MSLLGNSAGVVGVMSGSTVGLVHATTVTTVPAGRAVVGVFTSAGSVSFPFRTPVARPVSATAGGVSLVASGVETVAAIVDGDSPGVARAGTSTALGVMTLGSWGAVGGAAFQLYATVSRFVIDQLLGWVPGLNPSAGERPRPDSEPLRQRGPR